MTFEKTYKVVWVDSINRLATGYFQIKAYGGPVGEGEGIDSVFFVAESMDACPRVGESVTLTIEPFVRPLLGTPTPPTKEE